MGQPGAAPAAAADRACQQQRQALSHCERPDPPVEGGRPRSRDGALLCPAQFPGAPEPLAAHDLIGINSILSVVDNRRYKRILYDVLDHDPTHEDIRAFLQRLHTALAVRDLTLRGMTTDGSPLYPTPLAEVFRGVPHQLCQFHVVKDIVKAVVQAVARERKRLAAQQPKVPRGRPRTQAAQQAARTKKRLAAQGAALFASRYLFVQRHLNNTERKTLWRVSRGLPQ